MCRGILDVRLRNGSDVTGNSSDRSSSVRNSPYSSWSGTRALRCGGHLVLPPAMLPKSSRLLKPTTFTNDKWDIYFGPSDLVLVVPDIFHLHQLPRPSRQAAPSLGLLPLEEPDEASGIDASLAVEGFLRLNGIDAKSCRAMRRLPAEAQKKLIKMDLRRRRTEDWGEEGG